MSCSGIVNHLRPITPPVAKVGMAPLDEGGVVLAAIEGFNAKLEEGIRRSENRIQKLEAENAELI
jgi:hypothetical protein